MAKMTAIAFALVGALWLGQAALAGTDSKDKEEPKPSFKPGASVTLKLELKAPEGWHINYMAPVAVSFDKEMLKDAPFSVEKTEFLYKFDDYKKSFTAEVPIKLKDSLKDGQIAVDLHLDLSVCEKVSDICTFISEERTIPVQILHSAPKGSKNQAQAKGDLIVPLLLHAM